MLVLDHLAYRHPGQASGYDFSMQAAPGEITAVSGASGSGKSTLLDLVAGFLTPLGGTLTLDGRNLVPLAPEERPVSILFQAETLFEHLTAAHNVALGLPAGTPKAERDGKVAEALADVGLKDIGHQRADTLSGGQKQRVGLARTLLRNRPVRDARPGEGAYRTGGLDHHPRQPPCRRRGCSGDPEVPDRRRKAATGLKPCSPRPGRPR